MKKVEFKIGEEFQLGLSQLKCIVQREDKGMDCDGCYFEDYDNCTEINNDISGLCTSTQRSDGKDVIFIKN